jgi:hypothetical protein
MMQSLSGEQVRQRENARTAELIPQTEKPSSIKACAERPADEGETNSG